MKALIDEVSTLVVQVEEVPFDVDSAHFWVDCGPEIIAGKFTYVNGVFAPVPDVIYVATAEENVATAKKILLETDWLAQDSIADSTKSDPYITNQDQIFAYRNIIRQIVFSAPAGNITWPATVVPVWSNNA
jgi:hypothetical protein